MLHRIPETLHRFHIDRSDGIVLGAGFLLFLATATRLVSHLPLRMAGWLTFLAMIILPGYLLARISARHLNLDGLEQLAMAFPVGVAVYAIPGLSAVVLNLTYHSLNQIWLATMGLVFLGSALWLAWPRKENAPVPRPRWAWSEILLLLFLAAAFALCYPTLSTYAVDGDLFTFLAKVSEELTGRPMNISEPIFGSGLGPGVRSEFNQFSPIWTLWSVLSGVHPVDLTAYVSRAIFGLWAIFSAYMFGKEAANGNRRMGLLTASIQMLIFLAAPFFRADNASTFYLQRTNADKFTISVTMLPVIFALGLVYLREGHAVAWLGAAIGAFAVSTIHPLIASMLALGLGAFGVVHLLLHLRSRQSWVRVVFLAGVAVITMVLPLSLLVMSRSSAPLAPTYPTSLEGWLVGKELAPVAPFTSLPNLDWYGPIPELSRLDAEQANSPASPFLIWRYAFNMRRQRLIIFDLHRYITDPGIVLEPPYLLAYLTLPLLLIGIRSHLGAQLSVGVAVALLLTMYTPVLTPRIGQVVVPWLLWRMIWLLPYAFMLALVVDRLLHLAARTAAGLLHRPKWQEGLVGAASVGMIAAVSLLAAPFIRINLQETQYMLNLPSLFPAPGQLFERLDEETRQNGAVTVAANQSLSVTIPVYAPKASVIGHRVFNTSELFPADMQDVALQRLIDQDDLINTPYLTATSIDILKRYQVEYIVTSSGSNLDFQLRLSPQWFEWLVDDESFSLYRVIEIPSLTESILGNSELPENRFDEALKHFEIALEQNPDDLLAMAGLAATYRAQGQFTDALTVLQKIEAKHVCPTVQYRLGQLYAEMGELELSIAALKEAAQEAPAIPRYQLTLGDVCQRAGELLCAQQAYEQGVTDVDDEVNRLVTLGRRWLQRGNPNIALEYYRKAADLRPSQQTLLTLAGVYQAVGQYDRAEETLQTALKNKPFSADVYSRKAQLEIARGEVDEGLASYRRAIWLEDLQMKDSSQTRMALARALTLLGRNDEAETELDQVLRIQPYNTSAFILLGNVYLQQNRMEDAIAMYQKTLALDPTQAAAYLSLRDVYQQQAALDENLDMLEQGVMQNPEEPRMFLYLGNQLQRLGNTQAAISANQLALNLLEPDETASSTSLEATNRLKASTYRQLAAIFEDMGAFEKALNYYQAAAAAYPANLLTQIQLGDALRRHAGPEAAEVVYRNVLTANPDYLPAMVSLADLYASLGDFNGSEDLYRQALEIAMSTADQPQGTLTELGMYLLSRETHESGLLLGSLDESAGPAAGSSGGAEWVDLADFTLYLETESSSTGVDALAQIYRRTNQIDKAIQLYESTLAEERGNLSSAVLAGYYSRLGNLYATQGATDRAMAAYRQAIHLNSSATAPPLGMANVLLSQGDAAGAVKQLEAVAETMPGVTSMQLALARALEAAGDTDRALDIYTAQAQDHPGSESANLALAHAYQQQGRYPESEAAYRKLISVYPGSAAAHTGLARLEMALGRLGDVESSFRTAIRLDRSYADAYLGLGDLLARQGRFEGAIRFYKQAIELAPLEMRAYTALAGVYHTNGDLDQAIQVLEIGLAALPGSGDAWTQLAAIYREQDRAELAETTLRQAIDQFPTNPALRLALADLYQSQAKDAAALEQLRLAVETNPASVETRVRYANELYRQGQLEQAEALYRQAEQSSTPTAAGYRALAGASSSQGQTEAALDWLANALQVAPYDPVTWLRLAQYQSQQGQVDDALASIRQAVALSPGQAQAWVSLGEALLASGQREEGLQSLEQALAVQPGYLPAYQALIDAYADDDPGNQSALLMERARAAAPGAYQVDLMQANLLADRGEWEAAEKAAHQAIAKAPGQVEPYISLGGILSSQSRFEEAAAAYQQALERDRRSGIAYTRLSTIYQTLGNAGQAEQVLRQGAAVLQEASEAWIQLAGIYRDQGRPEEAEAVLLQALAQAPTNTPLRLSLVDLYQAQARSDAALEQLRLAVEANPASVETRVRYANELYRQGQLEQAEALYRQAGQNPALTASGCRALAAARSGQGDLEAANEWLGLALTLAPSDPLNWSSLAGMQTQQGQAEAALSSLRQAAALGPGQVQIWVSLGEALMANGRRREGLDALEQALVIQPDYMPAYQALIDAYAGDERAYELLEQARAAAPGSYQVDLMRAGLLEDQGLWREAEAAVRQAIAKAPGRAEPYLSLGSLFTRQSRFNEAIAAYHQAIQMEPLREGAANGLTNIYSRMALTEETADFLVRSAYLAAVFSKSPAPQTGLLNWLLNQEYP